MRRYTRPFGAVLVALVLAFAVAVEAAETQAPPRPPIAAQPLEEPLKETQVVVEIAGSFDSPRPLEEADEAHELG